MKSLRDKKGWSQKELSEKMGVTSSFVGNIENLNERHKYSVGHIALLSKAFNYKSPSKLFHFTSPEYDEVKLKVKVTKENYTTTTKDGVEIKKSRVISSELLDIIPTKDFII
ncbi:helix-turn-helix domain-containing protein [Sphingobacterium kitahiroshimense]|uniref:helix-turn-helix domain-containing protein n=1 Tax=Sphingobacterium kitahiroshimense TaxID=470446 RepID=UPI0032088B6D